MLRRARRRVRWWLRERRANRRHATASPRILVTRHPQGRPRLFDPLLQWMEARAPEARRHFELRMFPVRVRDRDRYALYAPWLQDPVQQWSPETYARSLALTEQFRAWGVDTINPVDRLTNASKAEGNRRMASAGVRTPRVDPVNGRVALPPPFLVREEWGHAMGERFEEGAVVLCREAPEREDWSRFERPVAIEYVDVRSPADGLYRKYRYFAAGDIGVAHHMQAAENWWVKGDRLVYGEALREEELAYLAGPDPNHELLQAARRALDLDLVAFDYSYDGGGRLVVWEANPYPFVHLPSNLVGRRLEHRIPAAERTLAAMAHLYLTRAGLDVPDAIRETLEH